MFKLLQLQMKVLIVQECGLTPILIKHWQSIRMLKVQSIRMTNQEDPVVSFLLIW